MQQLEADTGTAQHLFRVRTISTVRVEYGDSRRQLSGRSMVVRDHDIDARHSSGLDRRVRHDPTVTGHHKTALQPDRGLQAGRTEIVSVLEAVRHEGLDVGAQFAQRSRQ
jgi:hypothetical protein